MAEGISESRQTAAEIVTLANSANYIFANLKKDPSVLSLSISKSGEAILGWLRENLPIDPKTVGELTSQYVHLVALSLKEPREYLSTLDDLPLDRLEWGRRLAAMIRAGARGTTVINVKIPPRVAFPGQIGGVGRAVPQGATPPKIIVTGYEK